MGFFDSWSEAGNEIGHAWDQDLGKNGFYGSFNNPRQWANTDTFGLYNALFPKKTPLETPSTAAPTLAQVNTTSIQNQLSREKFATSTVLTSGQGLLDEPTTTSSLLVGT